MNHLILQNYLSIKKKFVDDLVPTNVFSVFTVKFRSMYYSLCGVLYNMTKLYVVGYNTCKTNYLCSIVIVLLVILVITPTITPPNPYAI